MPVSVKKQVLGFQISVYDLLRMQILERKGDFRSIEFGDWIRKSLEYSCVNIPERFILMTYLCFSQQGE